MAACGGRRPALACAPRQVEMQLNEVAPTLATHNAFINVCAARAASLTELPRARHEQLQRLGVELDVQASAAHCLAAPPVCPPCALRVPSMTIEYH